MFHEKKCESRERRFFSRHGFGRGGFGGPEGRFGHRWGGGRESGRPFDHGELRMVILHLVAEKPRHGYEIIKAIEEGFGGGYTPSPGVVYPTLTMLEEMGHATVEEVGGKKMYTVTEQGRQTLAANEQAVRAAVERMRTMGEDQGHGPQPQLVRAVHNLKLALRLRARRGPLTAEQLKEVVDALEGAVAVVERT